MSADETPENVPTPPSLPEVESPPPDEILEGRDHPSVEEIIEQAQPREAIIDEQPGRAELLPDDAGDDGPATSA